MRFFVALFDWISNILSGLPNGSRASENYEAELERKKREQKHSRALAAQWQREDELKRQRGGIAPPPPDWRNQ